MDAEGRYNSPAEALVALLGELSPVETEQVALADACGRVLAEAAVTDRDSPPCDTSAMDGYAVRLADLGTNPLPVAGEVAIGTAPPAMPSGACLRIVTGAPVPAGADAVIRREDTDESDRARIVLRIPPAEIAPGQNIRRQGENSRAGSQVLPAGTLLNAPAVAALAAFGQARVAVRRRVRIGILNSGDELLPPEAPARPWQIRDSNGPGLEALFRRRPWCELVERQRVADSPGALREALAALLGRCDLVMTTGGVSAGDYDYVPQVVRECGGRVIFHRLPVRPGKPILGAVANGKAILGLPGNPVSALVCAQRFILPALRALAGAEPVESPRPRVELADADGKSLKLWWWRLVRLRAQGDVALVDNRGSGDLVALAASDGFVEIPPGESGRGPWPIYLWEA